MSAFTYTTTYVANIYILNYQRKGHFKPTKTPIAIGMTDEGSASNELTLEMYT